MTVNNFVVNSDSRFLAYTVDTSGEELYNLYVKDLSTKQVEVIKRTERRARPRDLLHGGEQSDAHESHVSVAGGAER